MLSGIVDWNERFQVLLAQTYEDASHELFRTSELRKWSLQFAEVAKEIGVVIISELRLPDHMRTIKPLGLSGIGGGTKSNFSSLNRREVHL